MIAIIKFIAIQLRSQYPILKNAVGSIMIANHQCSKQSPNQQSWSNRNHFLAIAIAFEQWLAIELEIIYNHVQWHFFTTFFYVKPWNLSWILLKNGQNQLLRHNAFKENNDSIVSDEYIDCKMIADHSPAIAIIYSNLWSYPDLNPDPWKIAIDDLVIADP